MHNLLTLVTLVVAISCSFASAADRKPDRDERTSKTATVAPQKDSAQPSVRATSRTPETTKGSDTRPVILQPINPDTIATLAPKAPVTGEQIKWQVIAGGGGHGISTNYAVDMTLGQTAVGGGVSTNYVGNFGFWQSFAPPSCCIGLTGNVDCDPAGGVDISDLSRLVDFLYVSFSPLCCEPAANIDGDPSNGIDISDLSALVDYLYVNFTPPAACQ